MGKLLIILPIIFTPFSVVNSQSIEYSNVSNILFSGVTDTLIIENIHNSVEIYQRVNNKKSWKSTQPYEREHLVSIAKKQVLDALKPFGYYQARVEIKTVKQKELNYHIKLGTPVIVNNVTLDINGGDDNRAVFKSWIKRFPLKKDSILIQPDYDDAKSKLIQLLQRFGYFDTRVTKQEIVVNTERTHADIAIAVETGQRYHYGDFSVLWINKQESNPYSDEFLSRYLTLKSGEAFDSQQLQNTQSNMSSSTYFSFVELRPLFNEVDNGVIPIQVILNAPKQYIYGLSLGFGTDSGPRFGTTFENKRVNKLGHRFNSDLNFSTDKQSLLLNYAIPSKNDKRNGLNVFGSVINDNSDARDSRVLLTGVDFNRSLSEQTQLSYGISYRDESFMESSVSQTSKLLLPSISWQTIQADDLLNPSRGYRVSANLRAAEESVGSDTSFVQFNINAKSVITYGKGRLLGRAQIAQTFIGSSDSLPSSLTFFAGGDNSVRGYGFESIGVTDDFDEIIGGENLVVASVEYEHSLKGPFAIAAFVDAGDAYDDNIDLQVGIGVGARWRLPFGAVRLDIASAQNLDGKPLRLHFTFGTDL